MIRLFFDTETTGLPKNNGYNRPAEDLDTWGTARLVQLSWILDIDRVQVGYGDLIIKPDGFLIPEEASNVHGITTERALREGVGCKQAVYHFLGAVRLADEVVGHNVEFDEHVVGSELFRYWGKNYMAGVKHIDTMKSGNVIEYVGIPSPRGYKWPKLMELYVKLFGHEFEGAHNSMMDVTATRECFWEGRDRGIF